MIDMYLSPPFPSPLLFVLLLNGICLNIPSERQTKKRTAGTIRVNFVFDSAI